MSRDICNKNVVLTMFLNYIANIVLTVVTLNVVPIIVDAKPLGYSSMLCQTHYMSMLLILIKTKQTEEKKKMKI